MEDLIVHTVKLIALLTAVATGVIGLLRLTEYLKHRGDASVQANAARQRVMRAYLDDANSDGSLR